MNIPTSTTMLAAALAGLAFTTSAQAASTFFFNANQSYRSAANSPFSSMAGSSLRLENFEDGLLNTAGLRADAGHVRGSSNGTDSVDADNGPVDNFGRSGHSYTSGSSKVINFKFQNVNNQRPTMAGLVWTDGNPNSKITFKAWDAYGVLIGKVTATLGDLLRNGKAAEDRFFGVMSDRGISRIQIASDFAGFEVDHIQFAYGFAVVPLPPAAALGLLGLAGVMANHWRKRGRYAADT